MVYAREDQLPQTSEANSYLTVVISYPNDVCYTHPVAGGVLRDCSDPVRGKHVVGNNLAVFDAGSRAILCRHFT
jgi:hypothetical protein